MFDAKQRYFDAVAAELAQRIIHPGLWARAVAKTGSDDGRARAIYINLRAKELQNAERQSRSVPFSLSRVSFPLTVFGSILAANLVLRYLYGQNPTVVNTCLPIIDCGLFMVAAAMRMRDIGNDPSTAWFLVIPIINLVMVGELFSQPHGYANSKSDDRCMRIVLWVYYPAIIFLILYFLKFLGPWWIVGNIFAAAILLTAAYLFSRRKNPSNPAG